MARLIDADKINYHEHTECMGHGDFETVRTVTDKEIAEIPTVDAIEVVGCRDCKQQNKIGDLEYEAQEREKIVVKLRKQWQDSEMFICTMCGHFDHKIDGNIVYGNKDCGEIVGYPYCKKFTPWISTSVRLPENIGLYLVIEKHWLDGSLGTKIAKWNTVDWFTADRKSKEITPRVTHWMPLPSTEGLQ